MIILAVDIRSKLSNLWEKLQRLDQTSSDGSKISGVCLRFQYQEVPNCEISGRFSFTTEKVPLTIIQNGICVPIQTNNFARSRLSCLQECYETWVLYNRIERISVWMKRWHRFCEHLKATWFTATNIRDTCLYYSHYNLFNCVIPITNITILI